MPICVVHTSVKDEDIPEGFEKGMAEKVAEVLLKPLTNVTVIVHGGCRLYRKETTLPSCVVQLYSIGVFDAARNPTYTPPLIEFIRSQLKLAENRVVIHYREAEKYQFGQ
ncbi:hypothetical protein LOTGIDRAFT_235179 [Lottia gigantea]|uniref:D-dopachrome decarboxylase n=1 Tax=Lottia gigantea TaxID=225164 RepID=V3Z835_LOTGI|nr:hypothetical protein LOTGIDRAFT_235179 [Lottia gigantea]ESO87008.1 hypothetical protein LOTGIDRAFT_235179 [Lottia gigantea]